MDVDPGQGRMATRNERGKWFITRSGRSRVRIHWSGRRRGLGSHGDPKISAGNGLSPVPAAAEFGFTGVGVVPA